MAKVGRNWDKGLDVTPCNWSFGSWGFWKLVADHQFKWAYLRITHGDEHCGSLVRGSNLQFAPYLIYGRQGIAASLKMGLIHTFDPKVDGAKQASFFSTVINTMRISASPRPDRGRLVDYFKLPPVIWLDEPGDTKQVQTGLTAFLNQWKLMGQVPPRLAMSAEYAATKGINSIPGIAAYELWVLDRSGVEHPAIPDAWVNLQSKIKYWQVEENTPIAGQMVGVSWAVQSALKLPEIKLPSFGIQSKLLMLAAFVGVVLYVNKQGRITERAESVYGAFDRER